MKARLQNDWRLYEAATIAELLEAMRSASPYPEHDLKAWMQAYSDRLRKWDGRAPIDCTTPETFWAAMVHRNHITPIEP